MQNQRQDAIREGMLANWTDQARKRIPDAIRQAWSIVVTVNEGNDIQAFKATVGGEPLFAIVKADRRSRIQETAISAEAMLPGGPYDLWREDERTNVLVLSAALSVQVGAPLPWTILRQAIDDALNARWLALAPESGPWPCDAAGASAVTLEVPDGATGAERGETEPAAEPLGTRMGAADLEPNELQDLVDVLPDVIRPRLACRCGFTFASRWETATRFPPNQ